MRGAIRRCVEQDKKLVTNRLSSSTRTRLQRFSQGESGCAGAKRLVEKFTSTESNTERFNIVTDMQKLVRRLRQPKDTLEEIRTVSSKCAQYRPLASAVY